MLFEMLSYAGLHIYNLFYSSWRTMLSDLYTYRTYYLGQSTPKP